MYKYLLPLILLVGCAPGPSSYPPLKADLDADQEVWKVSLDDGMTYYYVLGDQIHEHLDNNGSWSTPTDRDNVLVFSEATDDSLKIQVKTSTSYSTVNRFMTIVDGKVTGTVSAGSTSKSISGTTKKIN